jgi:hypothetical protein
VKAGETKTKCRSERIPKGSLDPHPVGWDLARPGLELDLAGESRQASSVGLPLENLPPAGPAGRLGAMTEALAERPCQLCGSRIRHVEVDEPGLCGPCGLRLRLGQVPAVGARCAVCGERRRRALTVWPLSGEPVCHTCAFYLKESRPWPRSIDEVARRLRRERRLQARPAPADPPDR